MEVEQKEQKHHGQILLGREVSEEMNYISQRSRSREIVCVYACLCVCVYVLCLCIGVCMCVICQSEFLGFEGVYEKENVEL